MTTSEQITALLDALAASEALARHGYSAFATPAGAVVLQKDKIFQGLWRATAAGLKWTPATGAQGSLLATTADEAVAHTITALGIVQD